MNAGQLKRLTVLAAIGALCVGGAVALGGSGSGAATGEPSEHAEIGPEPPASPPPDVAALRSAEQEAELRALLDRDYPLHGLVTAAQIHIRAEADPESNTVGWLRLGARVRLRGEARSTPRCSTGFYELYPRGFACAGQGIEVAEQPPESPIAETSADRESALPYRYLKVREPQVPEYHQLPSREAQRAAEAHGRRYAELLNDGQERRAERLRDHGIVGEPPRPAAVARYLQRNFFVASNGTEVRSRRRFARTIRGSYIKEAQLLETTGTEFTGLELGEERSLPLAWAVRVSRPLYRQDRADGTLRFRADDQLEAYERQVLVPWLRRERLGDRTYHVLEGPSGEVRYLREWFVAVAEAHERPRGVGEDEPWVHVDVSEQTLVVYRGDAAIYATLVSSGLDGHDTPRGEFRIRRKFISDTMANLGPDAGDDSYRIDDVPWTQYFEGSFALHGAFWHHRFGLQRSHGCVNLAPRDARWVFEHTWPVIPDGWHGVTTEARSGFTGSLVLVTD